VQTANLEKNGARTKPRAKQADKDLSQWPKGTPQTLTKLIASKLFSLISTSDDSLFGLLSKHPEFPPYRLLARWRRTTPWFAADWKTAREQQAEWLMKANDIKKNATKETAHLCRVQFDISKYVASRLHPEVWGDRPPQQAPNVYTSVQIGVVSPERMAELRNMLPATRALLKQNNGSEDGAKAKPKHPAIAGPARSP
jgi:hypothetical protein